ncbi:MAG: phytoene desaturase [Burkholderiaceae bacterium]|jgi:phytoene desaturase|nr:phytoene desaturase [Burkholderiaceae bacterium]MDG1108444.1 phytoene desaturase [Burkholderiaceae bacterium]MDO7594552.1 phytoene desaturase [Burkholderiaceae bacterium]MDO7717917.1 phytoene desaturase [Burkholderiaceae bacterium]MDP4697057.1 phytoene desaturase [Burkholderiaceae bacterium]|tara:strand:- start:503 stop:2098 length:1596 start_codon:yes stop_codon:yes gene_type:complete
MTNVYKSIDRHVDGTVGGGDGRGIDAASVNDVTPVSAGAPTAVVIGTGFGGLAAAIRLSVKGYRVQMLEKLDAPGGRAYVHKQDGFTFDAGPTIITLPHLIGELFTLCGREMKDHVDLRLMSPFYRIRFDDGTHFDYSNNDEEMLAQIEQLSPEDVQGFKNLMVASERCFQLGFVELGMVPFETFGDVVKAMPNLIKMKAWQTIYGLVAKHIKHPKLRIVMSFHPLLIGGNPYSVTAVYALIHSLERRWGVHSAMGGTGAIVNALVNLLEERQVPIRYNAPVTRIRVADGRATGVELDSGEFIPADIVVSNGDAAWTYRHLVEPQHRKHWTDRRIAKGKYSSGLFVWYFGTDRRYEDVPHHMMVLGPRYKGLLQDIFKNHTLSKDFSLYLYRPTATDPSLAPPGCDSFYVLSVVPNLSSETDWPAVTAQYQDAIATALEESVLPNLRQHVVSSKVTTPQDFQDRLWSYKGAGFGLEPILVQSAWFRPHNRSEDVDGLFMVGASSQPGAGVPSVLMSAKMLEQVVPHVKSHA